MAQWYRQSLAKALNGEIDWDTHAFKLTYHTSTYAFNLDTHAYVSDLTNELGTAGGYTVGGWALTLSTPTYVVANSFATARANTTAYLVGDVFRPSATNGFLYVVTVAGTSAGAPPTFPTVVGNTVADGTATISCVGSGIITLGGTNVTQTTFTAGPFRYGVISDRTAGTAATQPLVGLINYGTDQTGGGGTHTLTWSAQGILQLFLP